MDVAKTYVAHLKSKMTQEEIDAALMAKMEADEKEIERLRADLAEQCRLLGLGGEREARLMARLAESQAREARLREALTALVGETECECRNCMAAYDTLKCEAPAPPK